MVMDYTAVNNVFLLIYQLQSQSRMLGLSLAILEYKHYHMWHANVFCDFLELFHFYFWSSLPVTIFILLYLMYN